VRVFFFTCLGIDILLVGRAFVCTIITVACIFDNGVGRLS